MAATQGCAEHLRQIFDALSHIQTTAAERDRLKESNKKLLEACKGIALAVFEEPPPRSARWGNAVIVLRAAIAEAEKQG